MRGETTGQNIKNWRIQAGKELRKKWNSSREERERIKMKVKVILEKEAQ